MASGHEYIEYGLNDVTELFDSEVLSGQIIEIYQDDDTADVEVSGYGRQNSVPVFYHCQGKENTDGGSAAFSEDDSVLILKQGNDFYVIGFTDGLKPCHGTYLYMTFEGQCMVINLDTMQKDDEIPLNDGTGFAVFPCDLNIISVWKNALETIGHDCVRVDHDGNPGNPSYMNEYLSTRCTTSYEETYLTYPPVGCKKNIYDSNCTDSQTYLGQTKDNIYIAHREEYQDSLEDIWKWEVDYTQIYPFGMEFGLKNFRALSLTGVGGYVYGENTVEREGYFYHEHGYAGLDPRYDGSPCEKTHEEPYVIENSSATDTYYFKAPFSDDFTTEFIYNPSIEGTIKDDIRIAGGVVGDEDSPYLISWYNWVVNIQTPSGAIINKVNQLSVFFEEAEDNPNSLNPFDIQTNSDLKDFVLELIGDNDAIGLEMFLLK